MSRNRMKVRAQFVSRLTRLLGFAIIHLSKVVKKSRGVERASRPFAQFDLRVGQKG